MNSDAAACMTAIQNAYRALQSGDRLAARHWAEQAVRLDPDREEPWMMLAVVASPRASVAYLERAVALNPGNPRAAQGLQWAQQRLARSTHAIALPAPTVSVMSEPAQPVSPPIQVAPPPAAQPAPLTPPPSLQPEAAASPAPAVQDFVKSARGSKLPVLLRFALPVITLLALLCLAWIAWPGARLNAQLPGMPASATTVPIGGLSTALPTHSALTSLPSAMPVRSVSPTAFQPVTNTPTQTVTATSTPTATFTATAVPTSTATPTAPPSPTAAPVKPSATPTNTSYVVQRGDTLSKIATNQGVDIGDLISANNIANPSMINVGQKLVIPRGGWVPGAPSTQPPAAGVPPAPPAADGKKRILVSISQQHLYAYEGDKLVLSFVASTGRGGGTATGTFHILDKIKNAWSDPWGFWMPYWMGIYYAGPNLENGIHALPVLTNGQTIWGSDLGTPITYGCVVLGSNETKQLFNWADIGTPIVIVH